MFGNDILTIISDLTRLEMALDWSTNPKLSRAAGNEVIRSNERSFDAESTPDGRPWRGPHPRYARWKLLAGFGTRIGVLSGTLRRGIGAATTRVAGDALEVTPPHSVLKSLRDFDQGGAATGTGQPARPTWGLGRGDLDDLDRLVDDEVTRAIT